MANTLAQITAEALELSLEERTRLVDHLLDSIHPDDDTPLSEAWREEIKRRIQEIDDGIETIPAEEFFAGMRRKLG